MSQRISRDDLLELLNPTSQVEIRWDSGYIPLALERSWHFSLESVAPDIVETARDSIKTDPRPSLEGQPPHTRGIPGHNLRDAITWKITAPDPSDPGSEFQFQDAVIFVDASIIGEIGHVMEYGGYFRGRFYAERPFLWPAVNQHLYSYVEQMLVGGTFTPAGAALTPAKLFL